VTAEQLIIDAASLPVSDRLRVVEAIWDSLPENANPSPSPEVQFELDRRMDKYRQNPSTGMTLDELRERMDADPKK
jgi:putative addiction module component (TIGR02574 family)